MPAPLFTAPFFARLRDLMSPAGLLAINYFGRRDGNLAAVLCALRSGGFRHVRAFAERAHGEDAGAHPGFRSAWHVAQASGLRYGAWTLGLTPCSIAPDMVFAPPFTNGALWRSLSNGHWQNLSLMRLIRPPWAIGLN